MNEANPPDLKELLTLAAKAVGGTLSEGHTKHRTGPTWDDWEWIGALGITKDGITTYPHLNSGDGAELEAALGLCVTWGMRDVEVWHYESRKSWVASYAAHSGDKQAARRLATVRCAAAIGRAL